MGLSDGEKVRQDRKCRGMSVRQVVFMVSGRFYSFPILSEDNPFNNSCPHPLFVFYTWDLKGINISVFTLPLLYPLKTPL